MNSDAIGAQPHEGVVLIGRDVLHMHDQVAYLAEPIQHHMCGGGGRFGLDQWIGSSGEVVVLEIDDHERLGHQHNVHRTGAVCKCPVNSRV